VFAGKKSAQIREILISESAWEEMTCLFAPSLAAVLVDGFFYLLPFFAGRDAHQLLPAQPGTFRTRLIAFFLYVPKRFFREAVVAYAAF